MGRSEGNEGGIKRKMGGLNAKLRGFSGKLEDFERFGGEMEGCGWDLG